MCIIPHCAKWININCNFNASPGRRRCRCALLALCSAIIAIGRLNWWTVGVDYNDDDEWSWRTRNIQFWASGLVVTLLFGLFKFPTIIFTTVHTEKLCCNGVLLERERTHLPQINCIWCTLRKSESPLLDALRSRQLSPNILLDESCSSVSALLSYYFYWASIVKLSQNICVCILNFAAWRAWNYIKCTQSTHLLYTRVRLVITLNVKSAQMHIKQQTLINRNQLADPPDFPSPHKPTHTNTALCAWLLQNICLLHWPTNE